MRWEKIRPYIMSGGVALILGQFLVLVDYHYRIKVAYDNTNAWYDTATQWQIASENWELNARKMIAVNYACITKLRSYQEFVTQLFDPRLQNEAPIKPLDLIEAPKK
jgi:hypothetical protein